MVLSDYAQICNNWKSATVILTKFENSRSCGQWITFTFFVASKLTAQL